MRNLLFWAGAVCALALCGRAAWGDILRVVELAEEMEETY